VEEFLFLAKDTQQKHTVSSVHCAAEIWSTLGGYVCFEEVDSELTHASVTNLPESFDQLAVAIWLLD
jgi:hypothetical protein